MADEEEFCSYLPDNFKEYMYKELNWLPLRFSSSSKHFYGVVFWSREDHEPQHPFILPDGDISNLNKIITVLLYTTRNSWPDGPILVQYWAPITTKEGRSFLTTRNRPFYLISSDDRLGTEGLCGYRMICMDSKFDIDLDGGKTCEQHLPLPGRVFKHQFPESTPNVEFDSITEYPQRHDALRCGVRQSFAFPVFESSTQRCVGVIEVVSPVEHEDLRLLICIRYFQYGIYKHFEKLGLKCSVEFDHEAVELDDDKNEEEDTVRVSKRKGNKSGGTVKASTRKGDKSGATVKSSDREDNKKGVKIEISLEEILQTSEMKLEDAAQSLGVSKSTLKRVCRVYLIKRWPPRKKNKVVCSQLNESAPCVDLEQSSQLNLDDLPSAQPSATIVHTKPHDTTMQDANVVTIKAKYAEGNAIKFHLSLSSRLIELQQEVAQRLNLVAGTYCVKYKDEDGDLILITCDGDLQDYMSVSRLEGKTCIVVLLEPPVPITDHL